VPVTLNPGSYVVTQSTSSAYVTNYSAGCSSAIAAGDNLTCTIFDTALSQTPTSTPTSTPIADLSISKTVDNPVPHEGNTVHYTIFVQGLGPATSTGVIATDTLPAGLTFENATTTVGTYASSTGTWKIGDLSAGTTVQLMIAALVNAGTAGQTIYNTAVASENASTTDNNPGNNSSTVAITVQPNVCTSNCGGATSTPIGNIAIVKTVDNSKPHEGDTVHYTIVASALGPATSTGMVATDTLPVGLTFENATTTVGTYASSTGTWTIGDLSAGSNADLMIAALVNAGTAGQTIYNTVVVGENASTTNNNPNTSSTVPIVVQPNGCTSNCGGGSGSSTSTLTVVVSGLQASDTAQIAVADLTASTTNATSTGNASIPFLLKTNDNYAVAATTTAPNYSVATSTGCAGVLSGNMTCNVVFSLATSTPSTDADISVVKTVDSANPAPGATVNYTITVSALGPATSSIVTAQDLLPTGLSFVSATTSIGTYNMTSGAWTIGNLAPNATATLAIAAMVGSNEAGQTITNTATVSELSSLVDPNLANNSSSVSITVQTPGGGGCTSNCGGGGGGGGGGGTPTAEIGILKTVDNTTPQPGATIHYTVTIQAIGPSASIGVVAKDILPAGLTLVSASSSNGAYDIGSGTWSLNQVGVGSNPTLAITAIVNSTDPIGETITNTATVTESPTVNDPLTGNNSSSVSIVVGGSGGGGPTIGVPGGGTGGGGGGGSGTGTGSGVVLGASTSCGIYLDQYIHPIRKYLNTPAEVEKLQVFLNQNLGIHLPITGYYGPQTVAAVDQFQVKYHIEVLRPWLPYGLPNEYTSTDYVYKTTQRWINLIECSSLNLPIPQLP
jgi:uncharacterized repeat protein (TIGR01451 family)